MSEPNVVLVLCHDLGDFISPYGHPIDTPNLEHLAGEGVVLENHFSCGSVCSPSRGGLMTGCYPHTNGLMGLVHRGWRLNVDHRPPLPFLLTKAGYETCLFGLQHEDFSAERLGYQRALRPPRRNWCEEVTPLFTDWLEQREPDDPPFLACIGFTETHRIGLNPSHFQREPYQPADPAEVEVPAWLPDIPEVRQELADFYGAVNHMDKSVGRIVDALDEAGLSEETLFVFTSDHGPSFMHAKGTLYDGGTKVAALLRRPGTIPGGRRCEALTNHVDLLPTLFRLIGVPMPGSLTRRLEGSGFAPLVFGGSAVERAHLFAEKNYTNHYDPARMVRTARFKYIRKGLRTCIFDFLIPELELCPTGFRRNRSVFEFYPARRCTEELYDLEKDPGEMQNLVEDPAYADELEDLRETLDRHLEETDDPFRRLRNDLTMPERDYQRLRNRNG